MSKFPNVSRDRRSHIQTLRDEYLLMHDCRAYLKITNRYPLCKYGI